MSRGEGSAIKFICLRDVCLQHGMNEKGQAETQATSTESADSFFHDLAFLHWAAGTWDEL